MSQGSLLRPISFKTFLSQLFLILNESDIASYPDDKYLYKAHEIIDVSDETLLMSAENLFNGLRVIKWKATQISVI